MLARFKTDFRLQSKSSSFWSTPGNGNIWITLAKEENGCLLYNRESSFKLLTFTGNLIEGAFGCLTLGKNNSDFNTDAFMTAWFPSLLYRNHMSHDIRKPVFGICDQVRLKTACSLTEILDLESLGMLSWQRTTKVLIRLRGYAGWSDQHICCSCMAKTGFLTMWLLNSFFSTTCAVLVAISSHD